MVLGGRGAKGGSQEMFSRSYWYFAVAPWKSEGEPKIGTVSLDRRSWLQKCPPRGVAKRSLKMMKRESNKYLFGMKKPLRFRSSLLQKRKTNVFRYCFSASDYVEP